MYLQLYLQVIKYFREDKRTINEMITTLKRTDAQTGKEHSKMIKCVIPDTKGSTHTNLFECRNCKEKQYGTNPLHF